MPPDNDALSLADCLGFFGVGMILLAFFLNIYGLIEREGYPYVLVNLIGSTMAFWSSYLIDSLPFMVLEGTWAVVSLSALVQLLRSKG